MGITCEISLVRPENGSFTSGSTVSGAIRYILNKDEILDKITISLKGNGVLRMKTRNRSNNKKYKNKEEYVDIDHVIHSNEKNAPLSRGLYETQFSFTLPLNIPSSMKYVNDTLKYRVDCKILYYIRIKFERPGFLQFDKRFKKNITVVSRVTPKLPMVPTNYGNQNTFTTLSQLFSSKKSVIEIKANIQNSVLQPGGKININYEVLNNTTFVIKGVEIQLQEIYRFTSKKGRQAFFKEYIPFTDTKTSSIKSGHVQKMDITIDVPVDRISFDHSKMISRQYFVAIQAILPIPHSDPVLKIPVQIDVDTGMTAATTNESPPSYWEAVAEEPKGKSDEDYDDDEGDGDDSEDDEDSGDGGEGEKNLSKK